MERDELIDFLREHLRINVKTGESYNGGVGRGSMYDETKTIQLMLGDEVISEDSL